MHIINKDIITNEMIARAIEDLHKARLVTRLPIIISKHAYCTYVPHYILIMRMVNNLSLIYTTCKNMRQIPLSVLALKRQKSPFS